jgi:hypothetical protein
VFLSPRKISFFLLCQDDTHVGCQRFIGDIHPVVTCTFECSMGSKDSLKMAPKGSKRTVTYAPNAHITTDKAPRVHSFNLTYSIAHTTATSPYCLRSTNSLFFG